MRRKMSIIVSIMVLLAMIAACCSFGEMLQTNIAQSRESSASVSDGGRLVILDPGHGGIDAGKIGVNNAEEKEINLLDGQVVGQLHFIIILQFLEN